MPHPAKRDLEETRRDLERFLSKQIDGKAAVEDLRAPSDTGFSSDTLLFTLRTGRDTRKLVARIQPRGFNVFPKYDLTIQYRAMDALAKTDVPVPRMFWHDWSDATLGAPFYLMEQLDGWVPNDSPPMHITGKVADELSPAEREQLWWSGLEAMARVNRLDPAALDLLFLAEPERGATPLEQQMQFYEEFFRRDVPNSPRYPRIERALRWLDAHRPKDDATPGLCWGDSRLANQIFSGVECIGVLDWEMVRLGDPQQDLAWWITCDRCFSEGLNTPRLEGFPSRERTVARWESVTGHRATHLDFYEVLGLMKFAVIMARVSLQMKHYETLPEESDFDHDNLASQTLERKLDEVGAPR